MSVEVEAGLFAELYCPSCEKSFTAGPRCPHCASRLVKLVAATDTFVGRDLDGRFTVMEKLGQGGMGAVYRARQHSVNREVAIKIVHASRMSDPAVIKRFLREAKLLSRLSHPNAVGVLDFGQTDDGVFYLVMELVVGHTLDHELAQAGALPPARVVKIGSQICDALEVAHGMQIVHRDLKPANIMLLATGRDFVKVLDFGLAKSLEAVTESESRTFGTPAFISPERVNHGVCDGRADLYSLGCVLYLLATGRLPFQSESAHDMIAMHTYREPPPMEGVPAALAAVIELLLAKDPRDRYQTAGEVRQALEVALASLAIDGELRMSSQRMVQVSTGAPSVVSSQTLAAAIPVRRRRWPYVVAGLVAALGTAIAIGFSVGGSSGSGSSSFGEALAANTDGEPTQRPIRRRKPKPEDELAVVGGPPRTVGNGTEGAMAVAATPEETKPVAPVETKPVAPEETKPTPAPETKPVPPVETKPVPPVETKPVAPDELKPVAPSPPPPVAPPPVAKPTEVAKPEPVKPKPPERKPVAVEERPKRATPETPKKVPAKKPRRPAKPPAQRQVAQPAPAPAPTPAPAPEAAPKLPF